MSHQDIDAEKAILGAVLTLSGAKAIVGDLRARDFANEAHRYIWDAVLSLWAAGRAVDHLTLSESLKTRGQLVEVGGPAGLMALDAGGKWLSETSLREHVAIVKDRSARRRLADVLERARNATFDLNTTPDRIAAAALESLFVEGRGDDFETGDVDVYEQMDRWTAFQSGTPPPYLPAPHEALADIFKGFEGNLNVVAGRSGNFKTGFVADCVWHWVRHLGKKGALFGFEDGTSWLFDRLTARTLGIKYEDVGGVRLTPWQEQRYAEWCEFAVPILRERLMVHRGPGLFAKDLLAKMRRAIAEGAQFIVVDHGLRVKYLAPGERERYDMAIGHTMDAAAEMGRLAGVPIVVLWHLNRDSEEEDVPKRSDLKESSYLDAAARRIVVLWKRGERRLLTVVKANKGQEGVTAEVPLDHGGMYGLLALKGGGPVDFAAEARAAQEAKRAEKSGGKVNLFSGGTR